MQTLFDLLIEPFSYSFMQQGFLIVILLAIPSALLSCFLVLKGWSLMGDAISHSVLPGIVIAYMLAIPYAIGAFIAGITCAISTGYICDNSRLKEDTVMGIVFSSMFALGLVIMTKIESDVHLDRILFGDLLGTTWQDIGEVACISFIVSGFMIMKGKDLLLFVFDKQHAQAIGLPVRFLHYALLTVLSLTIVFSLKAVGMILVIALLIAPGSIAFLLSNNFMSMLKLSILISCSCSFLGVYISFYLDSAPAPTIIMIMSLLFIIVFIITSQTQKRRVAGNSRG
ncbi:iron (chelated) ABC transporter permease [Psychromonas sp. CNPT3]|uniref:metal ABC transporter permease n=1 Tax=Psychromonas sp. CNPT3 TaxID=314282 RepID=UPI0002C106D9|nr:metal ABC transporter permease [Psychromonas sp. CNPT3]AGH81199.1 iron (chelated) ABC transporter permease [Psychromonas sp. CNPT3]